MVSRVLISNEDHYTRKYKLFILLPINLMYLAGAYFQISNGDLAVGDLFLLFLSFSFAIGSVCVLASRNASFLSRLPAALSVPFFSPIFLCALSMSMVSDANSLFWQAIPIVMLSLVIMLTCYEYSTIDFDGLPPKLSADLFKRVGNRHFVLRRGVNVLQLSSLRDDESWFLSGKFWIIQKIFLVIFGLTAFVSFGMVRNGAGWYTIALLMSLLSFLVQPYLLILAIHAKLVYLKGQGRI